MLLRPAPRGYVCARLYLQACAGDGARAWVSSAWEQLRRRETSTPPTSLNAPRGNPDRLGRDFHDARHAAAMLVAHLFALLSRRPFAVGPLPALGPHQVAPVALPGGGEAADRLGEAEDEGEEQLMARIASMRQELRDVSGWGFRARQGCLDWCAVAGQEVAR
jgi:hypothetical protein